MIWYQSIPFWLQGLFPSLVWQKPAEQAVVYLTFDDGPHPDISRWVAEQLKPYGIKATFFCVGDNVRKYPETAAYLQSEGHRLGNHTMHHIKGWNNSTEDYIKDIELCQQQIDSNLFRPPYGRISRKQIKALKDKFHIVMWSLLSCDFDRNLNKEKALNGLKSKTKNGSIVVFHDSLKAESNLRYLLPKYLEFLHQSGYTCKTL